MPKKVNPDVSEYFSKLAKLGGHKRKRGFSNPETARKAALARWEKIKLEQQKLKENDTEIQKT